MARHSDIVAGLGYMFRLAWSVRSCVLGIGFIWSTEEALRVVDFARRHLQTLVAEGLITH